MTATTNAYSSDRGQVEITLSAANVTAHTEFTTAEAIIIDGVVRSFNRTNDPELPESSTKVTGSTTPIILVGGGLIEGEQWELVIIDDWTHDNDGGEWGTDTLSAYQIFHTLMYGAAVPSHPGGIAIAPDGDTAGKNEYTLTNPKLKAVGVPGIDADAADPNQITIKLSSSTHSVAVIT